MALNYYGCRNKALCLGALVHSSIRRTVRASANISLLPFTQSSSSAAITLQRTPSNKALSGLAAAASFVPEQLVVNRCPANGFGQLTTDDDVLLIGAVFVTSIGDVVH